MTTRTCLSWLYLMWLWVPCQLTMALLTLAQCTLLTLVSTMKEVAVTSCCTRSPAYLLEGQG